MVVGVEGGVKTCVVGPEVPEPGKNADDRAENGVPAAGVANTFPTNAVFLGGEGEGQESDGGQIAKRAGERVKGGVAGPQVDVT
jgi:hypothetical protein